MQLAKHLNLPYREGFIKNRYIGRTFIMPGQAVRRKSVRQKLNALGTEFKGKSVLIVDDSIVRGTTSQEIVQMAREAGARRVHFASAAPPVRFPNVYGIDMPTRSELIASDRSVEEIAREIGCDRLIYQDLADLIEDVRAGNPSIERFETSCFDGNYITGDVTPEYLKCLEANREDSERQRSREASSQLDLNLESAEKSGVIAMGEPTSGSAAELLRRHVVWWRAIAMSISRSTGCRSARQRRPTMLSSRGRSVIASILASTLSAATPARIFRTPAAFSRPRWRISPILSKGCSATVTATPTSCRSSAPITCVCCRASCPRVLRPEQTGLNCSTGWHRAASGKQCPAFDSAACRAAHWLHEPTAR